MSDEPITVILRVQVNNAAALLERARAAYLGTGGGDPEGAAKFLGTSDQPNLINCLTEILADASEDGVLEFPS